MAHYLTEKFREGRVAKGITVDQLAVLLELAPATVGNAERGQQPMRIEKIARAAHIFGTPLSDLYVEKPRRSRAA